jgi:hypothetical protein
MLLLICVSFLLPIALSTSLLTRTLSERMRLAELEDAGVRYQAPLVGLLVALTEYARVARAGLPPEQSRADIAAGFAALGELQVSLGERLATTPERLAVLEREALEPARLEAGFRAVDGQLATLSAFDRDSSLRQLLVDVRALVQYVGDTSALIQDPDLDSFYLMTLTTVALPQSVLHLDTVLAVRRARKRGSRSARPTDRRSRASSRSSARVISIVSAKPE